MLVEVPLWFLILQSAALAVAALIVTFVAFRQWFTARDKLRFDLFEMTQNRGNLRLRSDCARGRLPCSVLFTP